MAWQASGCRTPRLTRQSSFAKASAFADRRSEGSVTLLIAGLHLRRKPAEALAKAGGGRGIVLAALVHLRRWRASDSEPWLRPPIPARHRKKRGPLRIPFFMVAVQAVCGELVSGAGAAISLFNREKIGNFFSRTGKRICGSGNVSTALPQVQIPGMQQSSAYIVPKRPTDDCISAQPPLPNTHHYEKNGRALAPCPQVQMSTFSAISKASSTSMPKYLTVLSIFECPRRS